MSIIDYIKARKAKHNIDTEFYEDISKWENRHAMMLEDMLTGPKKPISLKKSEMEPENLIFYDISGSKLIDNNTLFTINATAIDTSVDYIQHIYPTYILLKDRKKSHEKPSINNTQMYRINYHKNKDTSLIEYTIDTLVNNEDTTTSQFFPKVFCSMDVCTSTRYHETKKVMTYKPLKDYKSGNRFLDKQKFEPVIDLYENRIIANFMKFAIHPRTNFNPDKEI